MGPGEAVMVLLKELDERKVEVDLELGANLNFVIWKIQMNGDIIQLIYAWPIRIRMSNQDKL